MRMRNKWVLTLLALLLGMATGCSSPDITSPSTAAGPNLTINRATVDLPPTTPNSCPGDAPTLFTVASDPSGSMTKFTFDWRQTGAATYILEIRVRDRNSAILVGFNTLTPRENGTLPVRYFTPGIYHFRLRGNCPSSLWSAEVVKGGSGGVPVPPVPTPPVPPPPVPQCNNECKPS